MLLLCLTCILIFKQVLIQVQCARLCICTVGWDEFNSSGEMYASILLLQSCLLSEQDMVTNEEKHSGDVTFKLEVSIPGCVL